ncbi:type VI secretion system membrane subunit TssM [uncultured Helicobacter sp.]|uniref:type VI secretion system membrane subunit TssM n=1 Tax=uncultured Helicobacter sp. TaxID=175537 RepID=UPI00374FB3A2
MYSIFFIFLFLFSILFYFYAPLIAFDGIHILGNMFVRIGIISLIWLFVFLYFFLKPTTDLIRSLKSEKRQLIKALKKEVAHTLQRAKRNYAIAISDAKNTWKKDLRLKKIPLVIVIGNEGAGKSSFINYSNIEYPLSDSLQSYKKLHKSTNNFGLYISKNGALLDTEGNYFAQESFFSPDNTDEIPEDNLDKNRDFLLKKSVWNKFLSFLNANIFHSKLNGIILVVDTQSFLTHPKEYSDDLIQYLVKRVNECEQNLGLKLPIYIVFSKIDLIEGMSEYWNIFGERVTNKALGLTLDSELRTEELQSDFQEMSKSLLYTFMNKNQMLHSLEDKKTAFLFLKQFDYLCALVTEFILQAHAQNKLKNKSHIRGVYFTSAYQENVPRNYLIDAICEKYDLKKPPAKSATKQNKYSYFVQSLLETIILRDSHLSSVIMKNIIFKTGAIVLSACLLAYGVSAYFLTKANKEVAQSEADLNNIITLLTNAKSYQKMNLQQKANLMLNLKTILKNYPYLFEKNILTQYLLLNTSYKGFLPAKSLYYTLNEDVISNTLIKEMERILQTNTTPESFVETFYMYMSLFDEAHLDKALLGAWIGKNWKHFDNYKIPKEDFMAGIEDLNPSNLAKSYQINPNNLEKSRQKLAQIPKQHRIYIIMAFRDSLKQQKFYNIRDKIGTAFNIVFENTEQFTSINRDFTKDGLKDFLANLQTNTQSALDIDTWCLDHASDSKDIKALEMDILTIYLGQYQQKWQDILSALTPKQYFNKDGMLHELQILSSVENPLNTLIKIISDNTDLNDALLLNDAYSLGLPSSDIKTKFVTISNYFKPYYDFSKKESFLDSKLNSLNTQSDMKEVAVGSIKERLAADIQNVSTKISDFTQNNTKDIKAKITYILEGSNEENDPFKKFTTDIKDLPPHIARYYDKLSQFSWKIIENTSGILLNNAWKSEIYTVFINEISPYYPFNTYSQESLPIESFKNFFGNQGSIQTFYQQYLSKLLLKRGNTYYLNPEYKSKITLSQEFITFLNKSIMLHSMFDANNNINLNFFLHCLDLSSDFGSLDISYNDQTLHYDHTLNQKIQIVVEQFNNTTELKFSVYDYNQNPQYKKLYIGEWAWLRFLKDTSKTQTSQNTLYFEGNTQWYFDFTIAPNPQMLFNLVDLLSHFTLPQSII